MRKLILQVWLSIDGFAADSRGGIAFFSDPRFNQGWEIDELSFLDSIDTIILGANTYRMFVDYWPKADISNELVADKLNSIPKLVFSKSLETAPWGEWEPARIERSDPAGIITGLKAQEGKNMVIWGSLSIAKYLVAKGLVDEYQICVTPVFLGSGISFLPEDHEIRMKLVRARPYESGIVALTYSAESAKQQAHQDLR